MNQPEFDLAESTISREQKEALRLHLYTFGWQTRSQICRALGWSERQVREVAEAMGADIVRGQSGFKLTALIYRDSGDIDRAVQAAAAAISQGQKMIAYGSALKLKLHGIVG